MLTQSELLAKETSSVLGGFPQVSEPARPRNIIQVTGPHDGPYDVYHDCSRLARDTDLGSALAVLVAGVNRAAIEQSRFFAVHSGVVASPNGVVAFPAMSGEGKTTLTAALVKRGFDYVSDEALVFNDDGKVLPYPKPFALSDWSAQALGLTPDGPETLVVASGLGGAVYTRTDPLTDVVIAEYGHQQPVLEETSKSEAIAALISLSFNHYKNPERAFRLATETARAVRVWRLHYGDPLEAAELVVTSLGN